MRLGGPILHGGKLDPEQWVRAHAERRYSAAYLPDFDNAALIQDYVREASKANLFIAEVGAWSNPLSADPETRERAIRFCKKKLEAAELAGARCCVNISGSRGAQWDGHDPANLTDDTFTLIVDTVRAIIDHVQPERTYYALEMMQWMYPDSVESYVRLIEAIDRRAFAVHLDPVNLIASPQLYYGNSALIEHCFTKLGPHIRSCHAKDITMSQQMTVHLDETRPGLGGLDYAQYVRQLGKLHPDMPLMLEHLESETEYQLAASYIRSVAEEVGVQIQ
ncbi:sugar phosphate isomerase/epimerase [Paenibacillus sp. OV219]|uniref:sugar phosphate isomerase/epimerase family protein n=1 Tax=Paenibacillus sp. OV219 TaxID=1884377 RepID=UPI0008C4AEFB|nr:sugar phosphate isomerase/epimerase [Paenibacillus sp. OV219]SEM56687.1 Sugar phosphate isomerase/epimerase [Paenibacillus sp. OV219]